MQQKRFKNTFGVTGSRKQLEAFAEVAEVLGWGKHGEDEVNISEEYPMLHFVGNLDRLPEGYIPKPNHYASDDNLRCTLYSLPSQWPEAIAAASEVEEVKFEVGKKYLDKRSGLIVLCCGFTDDEIFRGTVIKGGGGHTIGNYSNEWYKNLFTPYNESITI